ncbi:hypothetical protein [Streptomyces sp. NPDC058548]|uniref:hypothetical protein n=1 Tax=Streptomyces sp. NPDC058548 TaxID=3346545 RepID=UPI003656C633
MTTVIDGVSSTRRVPYDGWEPVPPREWDELILRGVTGLTIGVTAIAAVATTASIGGLLSTMVPDAVSYGMGFVFVSSWLSCLALEWLSRVNPKAAKPARIAGWFFLALSMGAVFAYGHTLNQPWAGGFGSCIDLLSKGLWTLLIRHHSVPLDEGVAHWVTEQEQKLASRELLGARLLRLNRRAAYQRATGGVEFQAAGAILASAETTTRSLPEAVAEPTPEPVPAPQPTPAAPVVPAVAQVAAPVLPTTPVVTSAAPLVPPAAPAPVPAQQLNGSVPPVPPADPADEQQAPVPPVAQISRPAIAAICRKEIGKDADVTDAALVAAALAAGHPKTDQLADTVRRTTQRIDPTRKARKVS